MAKRQRHNQEETHSIDLANTLMLLSNAIEITKKPLHHVHHDATEFECKTCNRKFSSFQALGGHRASHKKPKLEEQQHQHINNNKNRNPKMHECSICGMEFALGQALGGHMRKHRVSSAVVTNDDGEGFSSSSSSMISKDFAIKATPILKRSNSSKRVNIIMGMDLNLTPLENDLKLLFGNRAPQVDLSLF